MPINKASDVIELAIRLEREGVKFYRGLADAAQSNRARDVFMFLAAEEEKHAGLCRQMLDGLVEYKPKYDYPGEYGRFITDTASSTIEKLTRLAEPMTSGDLCEALDIGVRLEEAFIGFYTNMRGDLPDDQKGIVEELLAQEAEHKAKLAGFRAEKKLD